MSGLYDIELLALPPRYNAQVRKARLDADMTQTELAAQVGCSAATISGIERYAYSTPKDIYGEGIHRALGVPWPPAWLSYDEQMTVVDVLSYLLDILPRTEPEQQARILESAYEMLIRQFGFREEEESTDAPI